MLKIFGFVLFSILFQVSLYAQTNNQSEIEVLKKRVSELEEINKESSEILKRQLSDQHFDQNSRGYMEIKIGRSFLSPKDLEDENDDVFNDLDDANWENFDYANILDFEIGKTILGKDNVKHEIGIGYQHLRSKKLEAQFTPDGGGGKVKIHETIMAHTLFARYAYLFKTTISPKFYFGPGVTLGYSPVTKVLIEAERGNEGAQLYGENTSFLLEFFGKSKYEFSRYFHFVLTAGYRLQEAENLRLNAAELVTVKTKTDLDLSGFYALVGLAGSF